MSFSAQARKALVASLQRQVARLEAGRPPDDDQPVSTGSPALDSLLPAGGLRRGTLVEYLTASAGGGAATLALSAAREACREGRAFVVLDVVGTLRVPLPQDGTRSVPTTKFYPPAAAAWGIDLATMLVLRPPNQADALWALDQALRCPGVGAVWATCDRLDVRDFRRLQLAAECGRTLGLLSRPARLRGQSTWADVQWEVEQASSLPSPRVPKRSLHLLPPWTLRVELVRCRGKPGGESVLLQLDETDATWREVPRHATHSLPLPAQLADPIRLWRTRRA
jgi:protein ImuA